MMSAVRCRSTILKMTTYSVNAMDKKESKDVYSALHELGIPFTEIMHEPVFSVSDAQTIKSRIMGVGCKNLLLTGHKQKDYSLLLLEESKRADLRAVAKWMGTSRLTFATPAELWNCLRLHPARGGKSKASAQESFVLFCRNGKKNLQKLVQS